MISNNQWQSHPERSTPLTLRLIFWIALRLGRPFARALLYPISGYFLLFAPKQRRASFHYLNRVLNRPATWLDVGKHIHCFASTILDRLYLITAQFDQLQIQSPSESMPFKYTAQGTGCLLIGSHVGSFEVLRSLGVKKGTSPIKILMHEGQTPMIAQMLNRLNPEVAKTILTLSNRPTENLLKIKEAIDSVHVVGMMGDRVMDKKQEKTVQCLLLGAPVELPVTPILIAAALKVPLIVFFGLYHGKNNYQIYFEMLDEKITLSRNNRQADIQRYAQKYATILEKQIRQTPYNWFNFYDYWHDDSK
jgi:predicted LPLAT superfamily acyltransferase